MSEYFGHDQWTDALQHHGVLGMKWGVRRYQNADGSLTEKGKARYREISENEKRQKSETKTALKVLKAQKRKVDESARMAKNASIGYNKDAEAWQKSADKADHWWRRDKKKAGEYRKSSYESLQSAIASSDDAKRFLEQSRVLEVKIKNIESGKLKAGRDFIVQKDYNFFPNSVDKTLIEKKYNSGKKSTKTKK